jgi:hypothetical protein
METQQETDREKEQRRELLPILLRLSPDEQARYRAMGGELPRQIEDVRWRRGEILGKQHGNAHSRRNEFR